jgi:hypothetical protein
MAAIPNAVIQKHKVPFFSFIKGVLGGDLQTLAGCPFFLLLNKYLQVYGPVFNLSFGPKSFLVVSDPVMARHVLLETSPEKYCKGMLAEILDPIMGKGLIPANPAIWKVRHRAIVPSFHKQWLNRMIAIFAKAPKFSPMIYNANQPRGRSLTWKNDFAVSHSTLLAKLPSITTLVPSRTNCPLSRPSIAF